MIETYTVSTSEHDVLNRRDSGWSRHERAYGGWLGSEELMKDVAACDKLRGGGKQPMIRRFPNGATRSDVESDHGVLNT